MELDKLEPRECLKYFIELSAIPRGSGNEKAVSDYVYGFAKDMELEAWQDEAGNVIVRKPGTAGYEESPRIIIQGHLDMVCAKNSDSEHDFLNDGLKLVLDGDFIKAEGTTLGADNGTAVAMAMALLAANDIPHPPITVILTTEEETGMQGALKLSSGHLEGEKLINLDSAGEGVFTVGCAGGLRAHMSVEVNYVSPPKGFCGFTISIAGLRGGHSGLDINKGRANANKLLGKILSEINDKFDIYIVSVNGGEKENAISRESFGSFVLPANEAVDFSLHIKELTGRTKYEYRKSDPKITIRAELTPAPERVFSKEITKTVIAALNLLPSGMSYMEQELPGTVETSCNLGVVRTSEDEVTFSLSIRSSIESKKKEVMSQIKWAAALIGTKAVAGSDYPAWMYQEKSELRELFGETYEEITGKKPKFSAIHAGLECGLFLGKNPKLDVIALGPDVFDYHSPDERLSVSSFGRTWELVKAVLEKLK